MPKSYRNSFTSGYLDPLVAARSDLDQYPKGLRQGVNIILLPHGGFQRRPGTRFARQLTGLGDPEYHGRLARFRFNDEQQYGLHFRDNRLDIYQADTRITRIQTPWDNEDIPGLYLSPKAQTADTRIICNLAPEGTTSHANYAPRRLLRSPLTNPSAIKTFLTSTTVRVYQRDHKMINGDEIGLSGLEAVGGITATRLNDAHDVITYEDDKDGNAALGTDPLTRSGANDVDADLGFTHAFIVGDRIRFSGLAGFGGVPADQINRIQTITAVPAADTVRFAVESTVALGATGGGNAGHWKSESFYHVNVGGSTTGITAATGGGTVGRCWLLHSLEPDSDSTDWPRGVALDDLPQFDFEDSTSPAPKRAIQKLTFADMLAGDGYSLKLEVPAGRFSPGPYTIKTPKLLWVSGDIADNAAVMQNAIDSYTSTDAGGDPVVEVTFEGDDLGGGGPPYVFYFRFSDAVAYALIEVLKVSSASGTITPAHVVEGGATTEDVISNTRGWPGGCILYQGRLWLFNIFGRPSTILGGKLGLGNLFNFDKGSALDGDAIDATGEFDRVRHLVAERGLYALTEASEVPILGGADDEAISPTNINLKVSSRYGSSSVVPVSVSGRPIYCDTIGRTIRQVGPDENGAVESKDISILSQSLIRNPVAMELWRNPLGDYVCVVNDDGTMAVLCINQDQGVAGWVLWTTDGEFKDVCQVGDDLYVIVEREVDGETVYLLEAFDFDLYTDSAQSREDQIALGEAADFATGVRDNVGGWSHLEGATVQVRGNGLTLENAVVDGNGRIVPKTGDVIYRTSNVDAGLAIPTPTAEPMPPQLNDKMSIVGVKVHRHESRETFVDGYRLPDYLPGESVSSAASPLFTGIQPIQLRGWGSMLSTVITMPNPQPTTVLAVEFEVA